MESRDRLASHELLLGCSRREAELDQLEYLANRLSGWRDWGEVFSQAMTQKVFPLANKWLGSSAVRDIVPDLLQRLLQHASAINNKRTQYVLSEIEYLVKPALEEGLKPVLFKGPAIGVFYGDPSLRCTGDFSLDCPGDIDLLVSPDEIVDFVKLAKKVGYVFGKQEEGACITYEVTEADFELDPQAGRKHLPTMIRPDSWGQPFVGQIDIHPNVVRPSLAHCFDASGAVARAQTLEIGSVSTYVLEPADAIWACALSIHRDAASLLNVVMGSDLKLSRYCDIRELVLGSPCNTCQTVVERAHSAEARLALSHVFGAVDAFFPDTIPSDILRPLVSEYPAAQTHIVPGIPKIRGPEGLSNLGYWSRNVPSRIFDSKRALEVLPMWIGLGDISLNHPRTENLDYVLGARLSDVAKYIDGNHNGSDDPV